MTPGTLPDVLGIKPGAIREWRTLTDVLDRAAGEGHRPVCHGRDEWHNDHRGRSPLVAEVAEACGHCFARTACADFAEANGEPWGVWGGIDRSAAARGRRKAS